MVRSMTPSTPRSRKTEAFEGDRARREFDALCSRCYRGAFRTALRITRDVAEADDVTQESFIRAWRSFGRYDPAYPFEPWLARIVTNIAIDHCRRRNRRPALSLDAPCARDKDGKPLCVDLASEGDDPCETIEQRDTARAIVQALAQLPRPYRTAVELADIAQWSYKEIAAATGSRLGTVRSRLHRGRNMVRALMNRRRGVSAGAGRNGIEG